MLDRRFLRAVPLPDGLTAEGIFLALEATQDFFRTIREKANISLCDIVQANTFSGMVSNVFTNFLSQHSEYSLYSEQRYPDLKNERNNIGLEVKATTTKLKGGEGHNGHSGWHIVVCYMKTPDKDIEFIQVEIANLIGYEFENISDWKYLPSRRNSNQSQRTETYTTNEVGTAKLRDGSVYLNSEEIIINSRKITLRYRLRNRLPVPNFSPYFREGRES